jgi:WD40 repeat protein
LLANDLIKKGEKIWGLAWSPDGKILAIASSIIWLYDMTNPQTSPRALQRHNNHVNDIAFSPDGTMLAAVVHYGT